MTDKPAFPSRFALASSARSEAASSASNAAQSNAPAGGAVPAYPQPHHIDPRRGATPEDIKHISDQIATATRRLKNMLFGELAIYRTVVERLIENQRENVSIGHRASVESFTSTLVEIIGDLDHALSDLSSDVQADIERALED
jgi:hypothetical protein